MKFETLETLDGAQQANEGKAPRRQAGALLIITGAIFLLGLSGITILGYSPWLLMALLPAYWIAAAAYRRYRADGRVTARVLVTGLFSLLPFAYIAAAILGLNVAALWPIGLIAVGASLLLLGGAE
jgi:hypothetical protein